MNGITSEAGLTRLLGADSLDRWITFLTCASRESDRTGHENARKGKTTTMARSPSILLSEEVLKKQFHWSYPDVISKYNMTSFTSVDEFFNVLDVCKEDEVKSVIFVIGRISKKASVSRLIKLCNSTESADTKMAVMEALGVIGGARASRALIRYLLSDPVEVVRERAASSLRWVKHPEVAHDLVKVVGDKSETPFVREMAIEALGYHGADLGMRGLIESLSDPSPDVRFWAASALAFVSSTEPIEHLKLLSGTDTAVLKDWGSVAQSARDAIATIERRLKDDEEEGEDEIVEEGVVGPQSSWHNIRIVNKAEPGFAEGE